MKLVCPLCHRENVAIYVNSGFITIEDDKIFLQKFGSKEKKQVTKRIITSNISGECMSCHNEVPMMAAFVH